MFQDGCMLRLNNEAQEFNLLFFGIFTLFDFHRSCHRQLSRLLNKLEGPIGLPQAGKLHVIIRQQVHRVLLFGQSRIKT